MTLLRAIELYLELTGTTPTRFGKDALGDPMLLRDLREGRELRAGTRRRLVDHLRAGGIAA